MKRRRRGHEPIVVANTVLSPSCPRFRRRVACRPAVLILAVMASCADNGLAPTDAGTSTGDAIRPDIATDADAAPAATTDAGPGDGADAGVWPCAPPSDPTQPHGALAETGCMDEVNVTSFAASA